MCSPELFGPRQLSDLPDGREVAKNLLSTKPRILFLSGSLTYLYGYSFFSSPYSSTGGKSGIIFFIRIDTSVDRSKLWP